MKQIPVIVFILILILPFTVNATDTAYQWTDQQGHIHYGDNPPAIAHSRPIVLKQGSKRVDNEDGLRPAERDRIVHMEQRQKQQQQRADAARKRNDKQRVARQAACVNNRKMLDISRGRDTFKQYARYLRNNCW